MPVVSVFSLFGVLMGTRHHALTATKDLLGRGRSARPTLFFRPLGQEPLGAASFSITTATPAKHKLFFSERRGCSPSLDYQVTECSIRGAAPTGHEHELCALLINSCDSTTIFLFSCCLSLGPLMLPLAPAPPPNRRLVA